MTRASMTHLIGGGDRRPIHFKAEDVGSWGGVKEPLMEKTLIHCLLLVWKLDNLLVDSCFEIQNDVSLEAYLHNQQIKKHIINAL
jgi:hypothetical protein